MNISTIYKWQFSIAMLVITRGYLWRTTTLYRTAGESHTLVGYAPTFSACMPTIVTCFSNFSGSTHPFMAFFLFSDFSRQFFVTILRLELPLCLLISSGCRLFSYMFQLLSAHN